MDKVRIYELAKELNTNSKTLIDKLKAININVKNHMSILEEDELKAIYNYFGVNIKSIKNDELVENTSEIVKQEASTQVLVKPEVAKTEPAKPKKNAPRIIRTEVREIRTDAHTGITTEIRTEIKGDSRREVRTNVTKTEPPKPERTDLFEFRNADARKRPYDNRPDRPRTRVYDNKPNNDYRNDGVRKEVTHNVELETRNEIKPDTTEKVFSVNQQADLEAKAIKNEEKQIVATDNKVSPPVESPSAHKKQDTHQQQARGFNKQDRNNIQRTQPRQGAPRSFDKNNRPQTDNNRRPGSVDTKRPPFQHRVGQDSKPLNDNQQRFGAGQQRNKERDFIGEQLREASKDMPKVVSQEQPRQNKEAFTRDKFKDTKKEVNKPAKTSIKQDKGLRHDTIKTIGAEHKVSEILNEDGILLDLYDADGTQRKAKKNSALKQKRGEGKLLSQPEPVKVVLKIIIPDTITVKDLAEKLKKQASEVIKKLFSYGIMATLNQVIDFDTASTIAEEYGFTVEREVIVSEEDILFDESEDNAENLEARAPIVVVMGHVDHGKTSLLDAIRETNVIEKEAGGITQHIGAYSVKINNRKITFLDTPGHEAFTAMRARGAQVTDIAILVVAADDGVMPQTIEAINHAKAANVSIIVAVNKIDKPGANPDRVKQELMEYGLVAEEWGGDTICVNVSAKKREGIETLLEMVILAADMLDLKANQNKQAKGTVIEAKLDKGRGPVATVLVQRGTLKTGDAIIAGSTVGRIRAMTDDKGQKVKKAKPSTPVEIIGLPDVPEAGEVFYAVTDERIAKQLVEKRKIKQREQALRISSKVTLDDLFNQIQQGKVKDLNIIVKADVQGSVEAIKQSLEKLSNEEVRVKIIHGAVGAITESDVMLANVSNAIIIGFNVRPETTAREIAERDNVDIKLYRVIYEAIDDITAAMKGMLDPKFKEVILGHAEIRQIFKASGIGTIGGCYVTDGKISRNSEIRIIRNSIVIHEGKIASLKRFKEDVKEVATGFECGISVEKYNDIKENDVIEAFTEEKIVE